MADVTIAQQAYINDLYNQLDVPYLKRTRAQTIDQASLLIEELQRQLDAKANEGGLS
jgi:hypothetical protein